MKKIISLFQRNYDGDRLVRDEVVPGAEWVIAGEGIATRKFDGTCCMIKDGKFYKRYDAKHGKIPPAQFIPAQDPDLKTGHWPGWLLVGDGPEDKWFKDTWEEHLKQEYEIGGLPFEGTYELCGPKFQGNPEGLLKNVLIPHGTVILNDCPVTYDGLKSWFVGKDIEGVVWHHVHDGRMVKIKKKDFGLKRKE